jgi:predicted nucleic-acid-binding Zn-ribbon protein
MSKHEYQRTCHRCGTDWFVNDQTAKAKPKRQARMTGWMTPLFGAKRTELRAQAAQIEMFNVELAKLQACPACGSRSYRQQKMKV